MLSNLVKGRYNISAAYDLADSAIKALQGQYNEIYFEDHVAYDGAQFWKQTQVPDQQSLLHVFLHSWEAARWDESIFDLDSGSHPLVASYLSACGISPPAWLTPNALNSRTGQERVYSLIKKAMPHAANAAFQLLFQDREFLLLFADHVRQAMLKANAAKILGALYPVPRCKRYPRWLEKAIFLRDRGLCQSCGKDVSGLLNHMNMLHLDHLLPLKSGGTNDPTNFQLLCSACNLSKGGRRHAVKNINHSYW